nr:putative zinc finger, CCHC-type, retrotransposon Gag domain protein [Tanacetum cinerariifolium]
MDFNNFKVNVKPSLVNGQSVRVDEPSSNCEEERLSTPVKVRTESAENVGRKDKDKDKDKHKDREVGEERKLRRSPRLSTPATAPAKNSVGRNVGKMLALCADEGNKVNGSVRRSPRLSTPVIVPEPETKRKKKETSEVKRKSSGKVVSEKKKARLSSGLGSDVCFSGEESRVLELEYRGEVKPSKKQKVERERECCFVGEAVSEAEAMEKWAWRYELKAKRRKGQGWILNIMDAPPSPNHVFNFLEVEFEEDPQEEPEEEFEEDPKEDPEEDIKEELEAEDDVPPHATPSVGSLITSPPLSESSSDTEDVAPIIANEALGRLDDNIELLLSNVKYLEWCEKKRKTKMEASSSKIRKVKKRMDEIEEYEKTRVNPDNASGSRITNTGGSVNVQGCTHKTFMNGKPYPFNGTEGVVGLRRWIEKVEQVFEICKCAEEDKVMFAASTF